MTSRALLYGDTVDGVNLPDASVWARPGDGPQPGAAAPIPAAVPAGAPVGAGAVPPGAPPAPVVAPPPGTGWVLPVAGGRNRLVWGILAAAALMSVAAIVLTAVKWTTAPPPPTTATVTAGPPAFTAEQIAAAKKQACDASVTTNEPMTNVQRALVAIRDRNSSEAQAALANYQMVTMVETEFLKAQTTPAAPEAVRNAVKDYIGAVLVEVDGETRQLPLGDISLRVRAVKAAGSVLGQVCKE